MNVGGNRITLVFNEQLNTYALPHGGGLDFFSLTVGGEADTLTSVSFGYDRASLFFSSTIQQGQAVVVTYTDPSLRQ